MSDPVQSPRDATWDAPAKLGAAQADRIFAWFVALGAAVVAAVLEVAAIFPSQGRGLGSISAQAPLVAEQVVLAGGFAVAAVVVAVGLFSGSAAVVRGGGFLAGGITAGTAGLVVSTLGLDLATIPGGWGLWLQVLALLAGAAGALAALATTSSASSWRSLPRRADAGYAALVALAAAVLGYALLPSWDRYHIVSTVTGRSTVKEAGSVFSAHLPGWYQLGTWLTALVFFAVPLVALRSHRSRLWLAGVAGVAVSATAQALSGFVGMFGSGLANLETIYTPAQIKAYGLVLQSSLTPWWDLEVLALVTVVALVVLRWWDGATD